MATAALLLAGCTGGSGGTPPTHSSAARSTTPTSPTPTVSTPATIPPGSDYLALGDSVSFGYRESNARLAPDYADAADFTGFPELVADDLHLHVANASCPGETSSSLIDTSAPTFGCERGSLDDNPGYRSRYPLHVDYRGAQLAYGVRYLRAHPTTRLVTLMIGANDAFRCVAATSDHCLAEFGTTLSTIRRNVARILHAVRSTAGYTGRLVVVTYYAASYGGIAAGESSSLDAAVVHGASGTGAVVADGYGAFRRAARRAGGDSCAAGLLTRLEGGGCGVHPSAAGQRVLAAAVESAVRDP